MEDFMNKLHLTAALLAASITAPAFAQNVQDRTDPQNPKYVTPASPAGQGATDDHKDQSANSAQGKESAAADQSGSKNKQQQPMSPQQKKMKGNSSNKE